MARRPRLGLWVFKDPEERRKMKEAGLLVGLILAALFGFGAVARMNGWFGLDPDLGKRSHLIPGLLEHPQPDDPPGSAWPRRR